MAQIPAEIKKPLIDYIENLQKEIRVSGAIVFGSYAKATWIKDSDIDIAIFSDAFADKDRAESIAFLLERAMNYDLDIQPIAFDEKDWQNYQDNPFVNDIVATGVRIA